MIATFKETITSLQDNKYGQVIITKPLKPVIWYWTKYLILIAVIPLILVIVILTRFLPEIPQIIKSQLPEGTLTAKDHILTSTISQPLRYEESDMAIIFDLQASSSAIESISNGVLITKDKIIVKSADGQTQTRDYLNLPDFSVDKYQIADWLQNHRYQIWVAGMVVIIILGIIIFMLTWFYRILVSLFWSLVFWLFNRFITKNPLSYLQVFNLVIYASVLPLILSLLVMLYPNSLLSFINTLIFVYFTYSWIRNLSSPKSAPLTPANSPKSPKSKSIKT